MTEQYDNTDRGALFKNDRKETDNHPDYKGSLDVGGKDHWLSAWIKKSKDGKTYMSLSVKPKDEDAAKSPPARAKPAPAKPEDFADDIPF